MVGYRTPDIVSTRVFSPKFDIASVGMVRFAIVLAICVIGVAATVVLNSFSPFQLILGAIAGLAFFMFRRITVKERRFARLRPVGQRTQLPTGLLTGIAVIALITYFLIIDRGLVAPSTVGFTIITWVGFFGCLAFVLEAIEGILFYAKRRRGEELE